MTRPRENWPSGCEVCSASPSNPKSSYLNGSLDDWSTESSGSSTHELLASSRLRRTIAIPTRLHSAVRQAVHARDEVEVVGGYSADQSGLPLGPECLGFALPQSLCQDKKRQHLRLRDSRRPRSVQFQTLGRTVAPAIQRPYSSRSVSIPSRIRYQSDCTRPATKSLGAPGSVRRAKRDFRELSQCTAQAGTQTASPPTNRQPRWVPAACGYSRLIEDPSSPE